MERPSIPGFEIDECLGQGGMAVVWKARQISLNRIVAIKVLSRSLSAEEADLQRFQFEAQAAARLKHPGITQVYDAGVVDGLYFIVMEYVAGYTVGEWCRRKDRLGQDDILLVGECVADALNYAWESEKIIHCDIKPDNIIVDADGTVKVTDLGLARTISAVGGSPAPDEILGTPNFISPEQSAGKDELDCRTDIYSLGAALYYLATGRMLFQGHPPSEIMDLQITDHQRDPIDIYPDLSPELCWLIEKMLIKDREHRSRDWTVVLEDIDRVKKGKMPSGFLRDAHDSTIKRSAARAKPEPSAAPKISSGAAERARSTVAAQQKTGLHPLVWVGGFAAIALIVAAVMAVSQSTTMQPTGGPKVINPQGRPIQAKPTPPTRANPARKAYDQALGWSTRHPEDVDGAIQRLQAVARQYPGGSVAGEAASAVRELGRKHQERITQAIESLDAKALDRIDQNDYNGAVEIFMNFEGPLADATRQVREHKAEEITQMAALAGVSTPPDQEVADDPLDKRLGLLVDAIIASDWERMQGAANEMRWAPELSERREQVKSIISLVHRAAGVNADILQSFGEQTGQSVSIDLKSGRVDAEIRGVNDGYIETAAGRIALDDLASTEIFRRLVKETSPASSLRKGIAAMEAGSYTYASRFFRKVGDPLAAALVARVDELERAAME
ncbi:MAG: serine/threonine-protein kinase [Verrucomicrobia bacterium]|nr:serine/threonine-protein kinase [Verrucomicrobiota bacterium]MDA1085541.1 serine/threonine-protein kinase [Verrucomicrobiota bacterium]